MILPLGFFGSSGDLRQRDPFPSYLFVLAMEGLSGLLKKAKEGGSFSRLMSDGWKSNAPHQLITSVGWAPFA